MIIKYLSTKSGLIKLKISMLDCTDITGRYSYYTTNIYYSIYGDWVCQISDYDKAVVVIQTSKYIIKLSKQLEEILYKPINTNSYRAIEL